MRFLNCNSFRFLLAHQRRTMSSVHSNISARYQEAISTLNSLQTNESVLKTADQRGKSVQNILHYLSALNVQSDHIDQLNIIHVAGTKGKGSTCAFTESILRQYGYRTGFFSSPHLIEARERIRINGELISKEKFVDYFWPCYHAIVNAVQQSTDEHPLKMPFYFAFLTTMMLYVFIHEKIDVAIIEVGIGGEFDCTNVIRKPVVCGTASLGLDHVKLLGNTIDKIAWQKAGIFKPGVPAVTVSQPPEAMRVLYERAEERECSLIVAPTLNRYPNYPFHLSLAGDVQEINASLAIQLVLHWLHARGNQSYDQSMSSPLSEEILQGLATCRWPGRNEVVETDNATFYLDGAHTAESLEQCKNWFLHSISNQPESSSKTLIFYCSGDRQPDDLLPILIDCNFDQIVFCAPVASSSLITGNKSQAGKISQQNQWRATANIIGELDRLQAHVAAFEKLQKSGKDDPTAKKTPLIRCCQTVSEAVEWIDQNPPSSRPSILVTGSLYLVGAALKVLKSNSGNE